MVFPYPARGSLAAVALAVCATASAAEEDGQRHQDLLKSCGQISSEIGELLARGQANRRGFWENPGNRAIGAASAVFKPAIFLLGYNAYRHHQSAEAAVDVRGRIAALRRVSAGKQCFVR